MANLTLEYAISTYEKKCITCQDKIKKEHDKTAMKHLESQYEVYHDLATWLKELQSYRGQDRALSISNLSENVSYLISRNRLTQYEFCNMAQTSQATLYKILYMDCNPKVETLLSIAQAFGTTVDWLLAKHEFN